jgi:hypothetical protein
VIGISAPTCVPWTGKSGLRYVWSSEKIRCCLHAVCSGSHHDCLDSHDSVLSLMSWCNTLGNFSNLVFHEARRFHIINLLVQFQAHR